MTERDLTKLSLEELADAGAEAGFSAHDEAMRMQALAIGACAATHPVAAKFAVLGPDDFREFVLGAAKWAYREATGREWGAGEDGWQPIETAPKDGTPLRLFARAVNATAPVEMVGWFLPGEQRWIELCFGPNEPVGIVPTHWQPRSRFPRTE